MLICELTLAVRRTGHCEGMAEGGGEVWAGTSFVHTRSLKTIDPRAGGGGGVAGRQQNKTVVGDVESIIASKLHY